MINLSNTIIDEKGMLDLPIDKPLSPRKAFPIDRRCFFSNIKAAQSAAENAGEIGSKKTYYYGMKLCVDDGESVTWYTIQRNGTLLAEDHDGSTITGIKELRTDEKGTWYRMYYSDGNRVDFCAPKGEPGVALLVDKQFYIDTDEENNLVLHYVDGETPPKIDYNPETGELSLTLDGKKTNIGNIRGEKGDTIKVDSIDLVDYDANGNAIYKMTFEKDDRTFNFVVPKGKDGVVLGIKGHYFLEVDENNELSAYSQDGDVPPNFEYNPETGELYLVIDDFIKKSIGNIRGKEGAAGKDGVTPYIGENGNWFIGDDDTKKPSRGENGNALMTENQYYLEVDDDNNLNVIYHADGTPPDFEYDQETGDLYLLFDGAKKYIGNVKGANGDSSDLNIKNGSGENALQQIGNTAEADNTTALGIGNKIWRKGQTVVGKYSKHEGDGAITENDMLIVGAGTSDTDRRNCFTAGYYKDKGTSYIKLGGNYFPATTLRAWLSALAGITSEDVVFTKAMLINTLNKATCEVADNGTVYMILEV